MPPTVFINILHIIELSSLPVRGDGWLTALAADSNFIGKYAVFNLSLDDGTFFWI